MEEVMELGRKVGRGKSEGLQANDSVIYFFPLFSLLFFSLFMDEDFRL